jgi:hypothetical protein
MMLKAINTWVKGLNNSKLFAGIIMLIMNVGSRYIQVKFTKTQETFLRNYLLREVLIFSVCWMATRDLYLSIILTASFFVLTEHLFNEASSYCVLPTHYRELKNYLDQDGDGQVSEKEINEAVETLKRARDNKANKEKEALFTYFKQSTK